MANSDITPARLKEVLDYDPDTGTFTMKQMRGQKFPSGVTIPARAGSYGRIQIDGVRYKLHRLAYLYVYGMWPHGEIDHINGEPSDNRINNLRDVPHAVNVQNKRRAFTSSRSQLLGTYQAKRTGRWIAALKCKGVTVHVGSFATAAEAHAAYIKRKRELHPGCTI